MIGEEVMQKLKESESQTVTVNYVWFGKTKEDKGILRAVKLYDEIKLEQEGKSEMPLQTFIPFVGSNRALQKITGESGEVLYENELISLPHNLNSQGIYETMLATFGEKVAEKFRPKEKKENY